MLALFIAVTSTSMAVARGQMYDATGAIVLCTGTGPMTVLVDHEGQPVEQAPICPDCAFSFLDFVVSSSEVQLLSSSEYEISLGFETSDRPGRSVAQARVRGPPAV